MHENNVRINLCVRLYDLLHLAKDRYIILESHLEVSSHFNDEKQEKYFYLAKNMIQVVESILKNLRY